MVEEGEADADLLMKRPVIVKHSGNDTALWECGNPGVGFSHFHTPSDHDCGARP